MGQTDGYYKNDFMKQGPQDAFLDMIRTGYAYTIMLSKINLMKRDITELVHAQNKQDEHKRNNDAKEAFSQFHERLRSIT